MLISDVSVRRPVFAAVISLILVIVGVMAVSGMSIREYPDIQRPVVSISTNYRGAASDIVERRVTQVLDTGLVLRHFGQGLVETMAGVAATGAGQWDQAERHFDNALGKADEIGHVVEKHEIQRWQALMLGRRAEPADSDRARGLLQEAAAGYEALGLPFHAREASQLAH